MRPPRPQSPRYGRRVTRHESLRQRLPDQHTNEIIHFVRELQFERQPTSLGLQKKAPLPGIGQSCVEAGTNDSGFLDRVTDFTDSENESLDNEIARTQRKVQNPRMDPFLKEMLSCPRVCKMSNDYEVLARSIANKNVTTTPRNETPSKSKTPRKVAKVKTKNKKNAENFDGLANVRNLPPLSRDDIPERPSAPSPRLSPPTSDSDFIEDEIVEYLDIS